MNRVMEDHKEKHEFALFVELLSSLVENKQYGDEFVIFDEKLIHRMTNVLRLQVDDWCLFFDREVHIQCAIVSIVGKKEIRTVIQLKRENTVHYPKITFLLPLLKRDDYEQALYSLVEMGVNTIQLVTTKKTPLAWSNTRDNERAQRVMISAAEQSKNFAYPDIKPPIDFTVALEEKKAAVKIFFDPTGVDFFATMTMLYEKQPENIILFVGPEGDLNSEEKNKVRNSGFVFCALTPTILRSVQATALSAGFVRSLLASPSF
jgi:16S rRNA (uracil1498-N3)-methyltransferase